MHRKLRMYQLLALATLMVAALATSASPARASQVTNTAILSPGLGCTTNVGYTIKQGDIIRGSGSMACQSLGRFWRMYLSVTLQRHRWWGWQTLDNYKLGYSPTPQNWRVGVAWHCGSKGTYTYRTVVVGKIWNVLSGSVLTTTKISNNLRVRC
jgi:hypothetical protein